MTATLEIGAGTTVAGSALGASALAASARRLAADAARAVPLGEGRRWIRIAHTERYEAWMIVWPAGSGLGLHDHAGSAAGVAVVRGRLRERFLAGGRLHTRWWSSGLELALDADHTHEVWNLDDDEAVSIHVYSPPLGDVRFREEQQIQDPLRQEVG